MFPWIWRLIKPPVHRPFTGSAASRKNAWHRPLFPVSKRNWAFSRRPRRPLIGSFCLTNRQKPSEIRTFTGFPFCHTGTDSSALPCGSPVKAFQSFQRSAELALKLKNPVSAAMNVVNMAWALRRIPSPDYSTLKPRLSMLDRKTTTLLKRSQEVLDPSVLPDYHNKMGALILNDGEKDEHPSPEKAAQNLARLKQAGVHFTHGLAALKGIEMAESPMTRKAPVSRNTLALAAALQLKPGPRGPGTWGTIQCKDPCGKSP